MGRAEGNAPDLQVVPIANFQQLLTVRQRRLPEQKRQVLAVDPQGVLASWHRGLIGRWLLGVPRCLIGLGLEQAATWRRLGGRQGTPLALLLCPTTGRDL